ncbi:MAG: hypothetical protein ACKO2P_20375, partial [Planctomycetota bacterium]
MATSDKDTSRGDAGGNSHQSAEQASEAAGGAVAARTVRSASIPARSIRHETWLGIFVVMLLVFALGFLVYQKVEKHERQLTQAAIAPREAEVADAADGQPVGAAATDSTPAEFGTSADVAVTDPLNGAAASEPSPFSEAAELPGEGLQEPSADAAPVFAFSEPVEEPMAIGASAAGVNAEPDGENAAESPELLAMNNEEAITPVETATPAEPLEAGAPLEAEAAFALPENSGSESTPELMPAEPVAAVSGSDAENPFDAPEPDAQESMAAVAAAETPLEITAADNNSSPGFEGAPPLLLAAADPEPGAVAEAEQAGTAETADSGAALQLPDFALSPDTADGPADVGQMLESAAFPGEAPTPPEPAPLLALAEPAFAPGIGSQAGVAPPSAAFRAVTRPGTSRAGGRGRSEGRSTGADGTGRFSLAAFNTQNTAVQPGADDGEKHPSVIVQNGENYSKISKRVYGTTRYFSALAVFNQHRIPNPNTMRPGMIVLTPDARLLEERYPQLFIDRQPKVEQPSGFLLLDDGSPAYRVGARETLSEISERFLGRSTRWVEIYQLNRSVLP